MIQEPALLIPCPPAAVLSSAILHELAAHDGQGPIVEQCRTVFDPFPNTEGYVRIEQNVRRRHVIVVQSPCAYQGRSVNDALMDLLLCCDSLRRASVSAITLVLTEFPYQRQERKTKGREPISARLVADMIEDVLRPVPEKRIVCLDLHAPSIQGFFTIPVDALTALTELVPILAAHDYFTEVSPDMGGTKRTEEAQHIMVEYAPPNMKVEIAAIYKRREGPTKVEISWATGTHAIKDHNVVIIDDILATGGTARAAGVKCRELDAKKVGLAVTHPECSNNAWELLGPDVFDTVFVTDSLPLDRLPQPLPKHWHVISVAPLLAVAIKAVLLGESVSELVNRRPGLDTWVREPMKMTV